MTFSNSARSAVAATETGESSSPRIHDQCQAPLPACSLETMALPIELPGSGRRRIWPLMLSCYQLQESTQNRVGHMEFHAIHVPTINNHDDDNGDKDQNKPLQFNDPAQIVLSVESTVCPGGILDGKWGPPLNRMDDSTGRRRRHLLYPFASAHSTGRIGLHNLRITQPNPTEKQQQVNEKGGEEEGTDPLYTIDFCGQGPPIDDLDATGGRAPLCLSLNWQPSTTTENHSHGNNDTTTTFGADRLVSTYSDGRVALSQVMWTMPQDSTNPVLEAVMEHESCWRAHSLAPSCPTEVWSADFVSLGGGDGSDSSSSWMIASGADDGLVKFWDIRSLPTTTTTNEYAPVPRPAFQLSNWFEAGVTCLKHHPRRPHIVAIGSYDETVALCDVRYVSCSSNKATPLCRTTVGGGVWRLKWHPLVDESLLVAAMHGGCRILHVHDQSTTDWWDQDQRTDALPQLHVTREFCQHQSLAYGADWLVNPTTTTTKRKNTTMDVAASCSFYDQSVYLWDAHSS